MSKSSIEWTGHTWNPVRGCTKVSPGCAHCYAETFAERWRGVKGHAYEQGFDLRLAPEMLDVPLKRKKPTTYFVNSMSDLFHEDVPFDYIDRVFAVMALTPRHTFQLLTKRADRLRMYLTTGNRAELVAITAKALHTTVRPFALPSEAVFDARRIAFNQPWSIVAWPLSNVWLGVSVENQHFADERIPLLLRTPAAIRFISAEPLLGPFDLLRPLVWCAQACRTTGETSRCSECGEELSTGDFTDLDWVIVGGESGPSARPFEVAWARSIVNQCKAAGVPVFVKQLGALVIDRNDAGFEGDTPRSWPMDTATREWIDPGVYQGAPLRIILKKKGGDIAEWPADLQVREFPK